MPFDTTQQTIIPDQEVSSLTAKLAEIGVVPVPEQQSQEYMTAMIARYGTRYGQRWETYIFNRRTLRSQLEHPPFASHYVQDASAAPEQLIRLGERVQRHLPKAEFSVKYFYNDPLLFVNYHGECACLGIWNKGKIIAIAEPSRKGWLARLFRR